MLAGYANAIVEKHLKLPQGHYGKNVLKAADAKEVIFVMNITLIRNTGKATLDVQIKDIDYIVFGWE